MALKTHTISIFPYEKKRVCRKNRNHRDLDSTAIWQCLDKGCKYAVCDTCFKMHPPDYRTILIQD